MRVVTSGAKMQPDEAKVAEKLKEFNPDLIIVISPNAALPGPKAAREAFEGKPVIVISDAPAKKAKDEFKERGFNAKIILQVHDELLFDVPVDEKEAVSRVVKEIMENSIKLSVPIIVNIKEGDNWANVH